MVWERRSAAGFNFSPIIATTAPGSSDRRYHNIFGPEGTRIERPRKGPCRPLSRKVALAKLKGIPYIEVWGDGRQTRSFFLYIDVNA